MRHGAVPSRDFVEPQGPGSFWWLALFFRLFGATLETARAVLIATGVGLGLLTFWLSRQLRATGLFAAAFVLVISVPVLPINSPHYDSNLLVLAALAVFVVDKNPRIWRLMTAALLCGVATWMIQQKGCYVALALLASLRTWRTALLFAGAFVLTALAPFGYFAAVHALPQVWFANYEWPMQSYSALNATAYGFENWRNLGLLSIPFLLVTALPLLLPLTAFWSGRRWFTRDMLPYWLVAYALWFSELHRLDIGHLRNGTIVMAMLFFTICETANKTLLKNTGTALAACLTIAAALNLKAKWEMDVRQPTRRGMVYMAARQPLFSFLENHTRAGDEVFIYPYQPAYYFFEKLRNPTRYSYLNYHFHTDDQFREATRDLERKKVRYVVFDSWLSGARLAEIFPAYHHPEPAALIMEPYLESHYRLAADLGRFHILERLDRAR